MGDEDDRRAGLAGGVSSSGIRGSRDTRRPLPFAPPSSSRAWRMPCVNASVASCVAEADPDVHRSAYDRTASQHSENHAASVAFRGVGRSGNGDSCVKCIHDVNSLPLLGSWPLGLAIGSREAPTFSRFPHN